MDIDKYIHFQYSNFQKWIKINKLKQMKDFKSIITLTKLFGPIHLSKFWVMYFSICKCKIIAQSYHASNEICSNYKI